MKVKIAIAGLGNGASSLLQGMEYSRQTLGDGADSGGLMHYSIGPERLDDDHIHIGPSDYVAWQNDNKVCFLRMEGRGFASVPLTIELRLSVEDSPNSAAIECRAAGCDHAARGRASQIKHSRRPHQLPAAHVPPGRPSCARC